MTDREIKYGRVQERRVLTRALFPNVADVVIRVLLLVASKFG